jgi:hypothetical protein
MRTVLVLGLAAILVAGCVASGAASPDPSETLPSPTSTVDSSPAPSSSATPATPTATATAAVATPADPSPSASAATTEPTPPPVPPRPTGVSFRTDVVEVPGPTATDEITHRVTHTVRWQAPRDQGVEIRVYGVTECLAGPADPAPGTSGPCLLEHTLLPSSVMALAATAPAAAGEISWIAPFHYECTGPPVGPDGLDYESVVLAAYGSKGHSIFAIAEPGSWYEPAPDELVC